MPESDEQTPLPSFYGEALKEFFLEGQKAGVFRIDMPAKWFVRAYDFLLYAAVESAQRGEIATVGMAALVIKTFLDGATQSPASGTSNAGAERKE